MREKIGLLLISLYCSAPLNAKGLSYVNWGIAQDYPGDGTYSDVQTYSIGYLTQHMAQAFDFFGETGGWKDAGHYTGAKPGFFVAGGLVLDVKMPNSYASYSLGPAAISGPDTLLGSNFQIYHKLSIGLREDHKRIGLFIKHFSDAGLSSVNYGRNFMGFELQF